MSVKACSEGGDCGRHRHRALQRATLAKASLIGALLALRRYTTVLISGANHSRVVCGVRGRKLGRRSVRGIIIQGHSCLISQLWF